MSAPASKSEGQQGAPGFEPGTQGYCYHLSKFHIYALVYCIGVFLSGLFLFLFLDSTYK